MAVIIYPSGLFPAGHGPVVTAKKSLFEEELSTDIGITESSVYDFIVQGITDISTQDGLDPALSDTAEAIKNVTMAVESGVKITSYVIAVFYELMTTTISASTETSVNLQLVLSVATSLVVSGVAENIWQGVLQVASAVTTLTYINRGFEEDLSTVLGVTISIDEMVSFVEELTTTIALVTSSERNLVVLRSLSTTLSASTSTDASARFIEALQSDIGLAGVIQIGDAQYLAVSFNIANRGITEYDNFPFNSYTKFNNQYIAASDDGIYALSGSDDAGENILASIRTGLWDFEIVNKKIIPECYIGYTSDGTIVLKLMAVEDSGTKNEYWYELTRTNETEDTDRVELPRGVRSRYFQFELADKDGGDFRFDGITLYPVVLTRRIY